MPRFVTPTGHDNRKFKTSREQVKSHRQQAFLQFIITFMREVGDPSNKELVKMYGEAGYSTEGEYLGVLNNAQKLRRTLWPLIEEEIHCRVRGHAHEALKEILDLMKTSKSEQIRLKCAQDILTRSGVEAPKRIDVTTKDITEQSTEELTESLTSLLESLGVKVPETIEHSDVEEVEWTPNNETK